MKLGITYRYAADPLGNKTRLYIPGEFKNIFDELNVSLIPIVTEIGIDEIIKMCDGLIVPGSYADTNPYYYHEEPLKDKVYDVDEYAFDSLVISKFVKQQKPILGICGGHQELNVYFGGTLHQRIKNHGNGVKHEIKISKNSFIDSVYKKEIQTVNSYHFQAIKDVAPSLKVSAISNDGIIEAIEKDNIVGVQWHPEKDFDINFFNTWINTFFR